MTHKNGIRRSSFNSLGRSQLKGTWHRGILRSVCTGLCGSVFFVSVPGWCPSWWGWPAPLLVARLFASRFVCARLAGAPCGDGLRRLAPSLCFVVAGAPRVGDGPRRFGGLFLFWLVLPAGPRVLGLAWRSFFVAPCLCRCSCLLLCQAPQKNIYIWRWAGNPLLRT